MARGPKPKPEAVKAKRATVRSKRGAPAAKPLIAAAPTVAAPDFVEGEALGIWQRLAPVLVPAKLLTEADSMLFGRYCRNFALWLKLRRQIDAEGATYETESEHMSGKLKRAHPAFLIADRLERQLLAAEDRLGLNPAERQRIFAARAASGKTGDLGDLVDRMGDKASGEAAAQAAPAAAAAAPTEAGPIGLLN